MKTDYTTTFTTFAAPYGTSFYGCDEYNQSGDCTANSTAGTTQDTSIMAPLTGFFQQPPQILLPILLGIAILVAVLTYGLVKVIRRSSH